MAHACVLIADDEPSIRSLLRTLLAAEGYEVLEAANGQEVMDYIATDVPPSVILLDLSMPAPQGLEVLHRINNMVVRPRPRVIVLTANGSIARAVEALRMGAQDFLEKPCSAERLLAAIKDSLDQKVLAEAASPKGYATALDHAREHLADGRLVKAQACLRAVSRLAHHDPEFLYLLGLWHELSHQTADARSAYQMAAEHHPAAREALLKLCGPTQPHTGGNQ